MVIFDWDDSMYPTTAFLKKKNINTTQSYKDIPLELFREFGETLYLTFQTYIKIFGHQNIYIVTNGSVEWVLKSLINSSLFYKQKFVDKKDYFAALYNSFLELNITIISSKRLYAYQFPKKPMLWKSKTFCQIAAGQFDISSPDRVYIIISIGDSDTEYIAAREAGYLLMEKNVFYKMNNIIRLHRVKLKQKPSISDIIKQLRYLMAEAKNMNEEKGWIDVEFL